MSRGLLKVKGTLEWDQFWPDKGSDADTVVVHVDPSTFVFSSTGKAPFRPTRAFDNALVKGAHSQAPVRKGKMTVRLQGIDAPELHYAAQLSTNGKKFQHNHTKFRQLLAETSTVALRSSNGTTLQVPCEVRTAVQKPNDVFDMYGRFVGDIIIRHKGKRVNLNQWLVARGWAYPAYYNSMTPKEIKALRAKSTAAKKKGAVPFLAKKVGVLDLALVYRAKGPPEPQKDRGPVLMPKIFRRLVKFSVAQLNGQPVGAFRSYLAKQRDAWVPVSKFLKNPNVKPGATGASLATVINEKDAVTKRPGDLVFFEKPSKLVDATTGKPITTWW